MPTIKVTLSIGFVGAVHEDELEVNQEEWDECATEDEREALIDEHWTTWSNNYIEGSAVLIEE
mgnify:FL=1